jgi:DNA-binding XRE family transcriptional regulator
MSVQVIAQNGQPEWAVVPYNEYLSLLEQAEMLEDLQDFDSLHESLTAGTEELLPAGLVFALVEHENPVKAWREFRGFTRQQFAEKAGISLPFLCQIESGKRKGSVTILARIAALLNVEIDDLIPH